MTVDAIANTVTTPEKKSKRLQLWSARRLSGLKRSKSSPVIRKDAVGTDEREMQEGSERREDAWHLEDEIKEGSDEELGRTNGHGNGDGSGKDVYMDDVDATSIHTAFREDTSASASANVNAHKFDDSGDWAPNLFYAYARRTDDPRFSRFLLTFSTALVCAEWWSLIQQHFSGASREGAQFFSFTGDDIPGRAWKHAAFNHLRTKWMYSQIGDAVGAMGKGQEIIPLQDERGFPVLAGALSPPPQQLMRTITPEYERSDSRAGSFTDSLGPRDKEKMAKQLKRSSYSKRDSAVLLPSSPLINSIATSHNYHERSLSLPVLQPDSEAGLSHSHIPATPVVASAARSAFDFMRMEENLSRIERLMDANATQLSSLEHVQAANMERLTAALISNAEMIRQLGEGHAQLTEGQVRLGEACKELRRTIKERDARSEKANLRSLANLQSLQSMQSMPSVQSMQSAGSSSANATSSHGGVVKKGPRKIGRTVVGYVYAEPTSNGDGVKTGVQPAVEVKR